MSKDRFKRNKPVRKRRRVYVIAAEGEQTEEIYFSAFRGDKYRKNIHIEVLSSKKGHSSPQNVLRRLREYIKHYGLEKEDEAWLVIDVDNWGEEILADICQGCQKPGFYTAISNPCFELWLMLHQEKPKRVLHERECRIELEKLLGEYKKSKYNAQKLLSHVNLAIQHAEQMDRESNGPWPQGTGSHVYKLVRKIISE